VSRSVILGSKYKNSIFEDGMVIGKSNVELSCEMATKLAEAFGAQLPIGSTVLVSRHYDKSSRMLKRAFLGGLLASGVDVVDYNAIPSAVMRCSLSAHDHYLAGIHFHQKIDDPTSTVITFFNNEGLRINSEVAKKIEKAFFKETFRRVDHLHIGQIHALDHKREYGEYKKGMEAVLQAHKFKCLNCRVAVDMMHGMASEVFPDILNELGVDNIMFNAYPDEQRLSNINSLSKRTNEDMGSVITALKLDAGFVLYPHGQRLDLVCDEGMPLSKQTALYVVLTLLNLEARATGIKKRVFLPTWAADIVYFDQLEIERGQYANFKSAQMKQYDLVATGEGNFTFTEFATHRDSMYATLKILEMMVNHNVKLSHLIAQLPHFFYKTYQISCTQALKGKMMRKFLEDSKGKKCSTLDGVKIWFNENDWILMLPDQYSDHLNLTIQAQIDSQGEKYAQEYMDKITEWAIS
jgi:mannose-1-phosphate guanylyltransferase/phosphomannomutase